MSQRKLFPIINNTFRFHLTSKFGECHALGLDSATMEPNQTAAHQRSGCFVSVTCTAVVNAILHSVLADTYKVSITSGEYVRGA
jgi:hypothetical protein